MPVRIFWLVLGFVSLGAGLAGVVLPILPTTPFILLAAFSFARSSPRLHRWLLAHKRFGPLIENWRKYGAIGRRTKIYSLASMIAVFGLSLALRADAIVLVVQAVALGGAALFVATRPAPPAQATD